MSVTSPLTFRALVLTLSIPAAACAGSETGNGRKDGDPQEVWFQLGLDERPASTPLVIRDGGGASYRLESAVGSISELVVHLDGDSCKFDGVWSCGSDGDGGTLKIEGVFEVDLLGGPLVPQVFTPVGLSASDIRSFTAKWGGTELPTLDVHGTVQLSGEAEARPFGLLMDFTANTRFVVDAPGVGASATRDEAASSWRLALDPSSWFETVDLSACVRDGLVPTDADGVLRLEGAERRCRTVPAGIATGFRLDGVANVSE